MTKFYLAIILFAISFDLSSQKEYTYPIAPKDSTFNTYFDTTIYDPYQWMENPDDLRLAVWLEEQEELTKKKGRQQVKKSTLRAQLASMYHDVDGKKLDGYRNSDKVKKSKYQFETRFNSYKRSPDLFYKVREDGYYKMLVRIKDLEDKKGERVRIVGYLENEDDDLIAVYITRKGSDWREVHFYDLVSGEKLPGVLKDLKGGIVWKDSDVYYSRYSTPTKGRELLDNSKGQVLCFHKTGTEQDEDLRLYYNPDTSGTYRFRYQMIDDNLFLYHYYKYQGKYLKALSVANSNPNSFFLKNFLIYPNSDTIDVDIEYLKGDSAFIKTNWNSPNGRVLISDITQLNKVSEFIPEYDINLQEINKLGKGKIACTYLNDGKSSVLVFNDEGGFIKRFDFPEGKVVHGFYEDKDDKKYTEFYISSFYHPNLWYQLSLEELTYIPSRSVTVPYDAKSLETRYVKYKSKDGTEIPMYITCLKETKLDGKNPTLIYGYGGYGTVIEPHFDRQYALWLLHGGILAIPNVRGGGVDGASWAKAGRRLNKQNTIDDFISAAEYLIEQDYTNPEKIAIKGGSHGGMLVGAAITQRPELFKAVIARAGSFDMLRKENFAVSSVSTNVNEYGTVTDSLDFSNLLSYSPMHNVKEGINYPNVLLITGDSDDRVPPLQSYKFLATLQEKGSPKSEYLLYIIPNAGHNTTVVYEDWEKELL